MKILLVTNIVSPHQLPLARCLASTLGEHSFRFASIRPPSVERINLGWCCEGFEDWILRAGENDAHKIEFERWWNDADVVITGERLTDLIAFRLEDNKTTFLMSERWWKPPIGIARLLEPQFAMMTRSIFRMSKSPYFHFLAIGGYAASDMERLALFPRRKWQWGYFTELPNPLPEIKARKEPLRILWAGRMLACKRVDTLVRAFLVLLQREPKATLTLIGSGPRLPRLEKLVGHLGLVDRVRFLGSMPVPEVRVWMRESHIYVIPSNGYEGWGAVINEAMSEGDALVASEAAGAAKSIIRHGENGLLFSPGDWGQLAQYLCQLACDDTLRTRLAQAGQIAIKEIWSPEEAAKRFLLVCDAILTASPHPEYSCGPMMLI